MNPLATAGRCFAFRSLHPNTPTEMTTNETAELIRITAIAKKDRSAEDKVTFAALTLKAAEEDEDDEEEAGSGVKSLTRFDAALNSRSFASANASGAESFPLRAYDFDTDTDGNPALVGGTWVNNEIVNDTYAPLKGSDGQELAAQPSYIGGKKSIKFIVVDNTTGLKYRLSSTAFEAAHKSIGKKMSFASTQMGQTVDTSTQYARATVTLL